MNTRWTNQIKVSSHDTDFNQLMNTTALLAHLQDAATDQFDKYGPSINKLRAEGKAFVVSRIGLKEYAPIYYGDEITIHTWASSEKGVEFLRFFKVEKNGSTVAEMSSVWALIDINTRRFYRHSDIEAGFGIESPIDGEFSLRFTAPEFSEENFVGTRNICYSDVDRNGHMNNANYANMLCDFLPSESVKAENAEETHSLSVNSSMCPLLYGSRITEFAISFRSEARLGEEIRIYSLYSEDDGCYYFKTEHSDGKVGINAKMKIEKI